MDKSYKVIHFFQEKHKIVPWTKVSLEAISKRFSWGSSCVECSVEKGQIWLHAGGHAYLWKCSSPFGVASLSEDKRTTIPTMQYRCRSLSSGRVISTHEDSRWVLSRISLSLAPRREKPAVLSYEKRNPTEQTGGKVLAVLGGDTG